MFMIGKKFEKIETVSKILVDETVVAESKK